MAAPARAKRRTWKARIRRRGNAGSEYFSGVSGSAARLARFVIFRHCDSSASSAGRAAVNAARSALTSGGRPPRASSIISRSRMAGSMSTAPLIVNFDIHRTPQANHRGMQPRAHGPDGNLKDFGDFFVAEPIVQAKFQGLAQLRRQIRHCPSHGEQLRVPRRCRLLD